MGGEGVTVIEISSSDEEAGGEETGKTGRKGRLKRKTGPLRKGKTAGKKRVKDMEDLDCIVLDYNPFETTDLIKNQSVHDTDQDLYLLAERGQVACRDYPHSRHICVKFPFSQTPHDSYCDQCYCYVCDSKAPCKYWKGSELEHCHASDEEQIWNGIRRVHVGIRSVLRQTRSIAESG